MKLSIRQDMAPGNTLSDRLANLEELGFDGIELTPRNVTDWDGWVAEAKAAFAKSTVRPTIVEAGGGGCLLDPRREERDLAMEGLKRSLHCAAELGGIGVICVPLIAIRMSQGKRPRIPDLSPSASTYELERALFVELLGELGDYATKVGSYLILEPLNRYESFWLNRVEEGVELCKEVGSPGIMTMADFFHMHIEEADIPESIRQAKGYLANVHLADSNRQTPGNGFTNFRSGLAALKEIGYEHYMGLECGIPGDPWVELPKCVAYLRECDSYVT